MSIEQKILIADGDNSYCNKLKDAFEQEGFACQCADHLHKVADLIEKGCCDLLIADPSLAGGQGLDPIRLLVTGAGSTPLILITSQPSLESAIESLNLGVCAYMVKPVRMADLAAKAGSILRERRVFKAISAAQRRVQEWLSTLDTLRQLSASANSSTNAEETAQLYLSYTLNSIASSLVDLRNLAEALAADPSRRQHLSLPGEVPKGLLLDALKETVDVLERTKGAFKSKQLGDLRRKIEQVISV